MGQLFLVYFEGAEFSSALEEMIRDYHVGGLIFYSIAGNIQTLPQVAQLIAAAQAQALVPLWIAIDQEGGPVVRLTEGVTVFPSAMAVAAAGSLAKAEAMARAVGTELKSLGFNLNFAPVVDVNSNPHNPIIGIRAFGSDPKQVTDYGLALWRGYRQAGILCTPKHFPGHGDTDMDSHLGLPRVDRPLEALQTTELRPFQALIRAGAEAMMTAHVVMPALGSVGDSGTKSLQPATLAPEVVSGWLRQKLGFKGLVLTDSLTMGAIARTYGIPEAAELAFRAGADVLVFGADPGFSPAIQKEAYAHLLRELQERLASASPEERFDIEMDIDYAQSACSALEEALLPQEKNLQREYEELTRQEARLRQLQNQAAAPVQVDIGPLLEQIGSQKQDLLQEKGRLQTLIQQLESSLPSQQEQLARQRQELEQQWQHLEQEEGSLRARAQAMAETWGRLNHLQATLYPERDRWAALAGELAQLETELSQHQARNSTARDHVQQVHSLLATLAQA